MSAVQLDQLDVFYGDLTVTQGYVYARLPRRAETDGLTLAGQVRGPRCLYAETLPLTSPLIDLGPGPTVLARAMVPDPCFWSPDLPAIYDVTVSLLRGTEVVATTRREIGLRSLGARGRNLALEGKRFVLRGVRVAGTTATLPRLWHDAAAAYVVSQPAEESPAEESLAEASQWGALSVVELDECGEKLVTRLRELARYPGVALVVIHGELPADFQRAGAAPNLLLAQPLASGEPVRLHPWADLAWVAADDAREFARLASAVANAPIIAVRPLSAPLPIDESRAACDRLQRDLAPIGQFAGYIV